MSSARCLLCLFLFVSSVGFAQAPADTPPPLVPTQEEPEAPQDEPPEGESFPYEYKPKHQTASTLGRILLETAAGSGAVIVSTLATATAASALFILGAEDADPYFAVGAVGALVLLGSTPLAVYGTGRALGGHGSFLASLLGTVLGTTVGLLGALPIIRRDERGGTLSTILIAAGPVVGAVVGYEISHSFNQPEPPPSEYASSRSGFQITPVVGVTRSGGILGGLALRF